MGIDWAFFRKKRHMVFFAEGLHQFDQYGVDARVVHFEDAEAQGVPSQGFSLMGNVLEAVENQTADGGKLGGVEVFFVEVSQEVVERTLAAHHPTAAIGTLDDVGHLGGFVDAAHKTFENVFEGDDALNEAKFVTDQCAVETTRLELFQGFIDRHVLREIDGLLHDFREGEIGLAQMEHQFLERHDTFHVS